MPRAADSPPPNSRPWYHGVSAYDWLVLLIASAGWIFDAYEGQIFNITRGQLLAELAPSGTTPEQIRLYGDLFLGIFLAGGTLGGLVFGSLADRWGRRPTMILTVLVYSAFTGLTCLAGSLWQVAALRFLVAMGVGGEWAVAAALVAEVFPQRARAQASGLFHSTSVLGTWLAALAGMAVGSNWRAAYLVGILPALLTLWIRARVAEPKSWSRAEAQAREGGPRLGNYRDLLLTRPWAGRALLGMLLAAVGLGTFWGVTVAGQDLACDFLTRHGVEPSVAANRAKFAYGIVQAAGGGLGMFSFGPLCAWLGRRRAFVGIQLAALAIVPVTCYLPATYGQLLLLLPVYGFLTQAMHAGFAVYFPELFPTHLRATGSGFCFNGGRIVAAGVLVGSGALKAIPGIDLRLAITLLSSIFVLGIAAVLGMPETKGQPLPE